MRKKMLVMFATLGCLMVPSCLNTNADEILSTVSNLACERFATDHFDICDTFSIDFG